MRRIAPVGKDLKIIQLVTGMEGYKVIQKYKTGDPTIIPKMKLI